MRKLLRDSTATQFKQSNQISKWDAKRNFWVKIDGDAETIAVGKHGKTVIITNNQK